MTGLWNLKNIPNLRHNRSNILVSENAVARAHGNCLLRVMGCSFQLFLNEILQCYN